MGTESEARLETAVEACAAVEDVGGRCGCMRELDETVGDMDDERGGGGGFCGCADGIGRLWGGTGGRVCCLLYDTGLRGGKATRE